MRISSLSFVKSSSSYFFFIGQPESWSQSPSERFLELLIS